MLAEAAKINYLIEWKRGDASKLPFETNCYDLIIARHMLYHVKDVEKQFKAFIKSFVLAEHF